MTHRERTLRVMRGMTPDRLPWVVRMDLWYDAHNKAGTLPREYRGLSQWDLQRRLDMGVFGIRGKIFDLRYRDVEVQNFIRDGKQVTEYKTPVGMVYEEQESSDALDSAGIHPYFVSHMIKKPEDYRVAQFIVEHTELIPTYGEFQTFSDSIGEDGVAVADLRMSPMQTIMRDLVGMERACYDLYDHPDLVQSLYEALSDLVRKKLQLAAESPAEVIEYCGNFSSKVIGPPLFRSHFVPRFQEAADMLHPHGKILMTHTDGEMRGLLELIPECGIDVIEAFTPVPMTSLSVVEAKRVLGERVVIWGGIPSVILCLTYSEEAFDAYMRKIFEEIGPPGKFILGMGDNVPTDGIFDRMLKITEMVSATSG